ncbi:MAG TPA: hypothetical protein VF491_14805 [Vicinamibacterales bacterium]
MGGRARTTILVLQMLLATAASAVAQEPESSFDALSGRLRIGQSIWVTDPAGREVHGRLEGLTSDGLVVKMAGRTTLAAADVRLIRVRSRDSVKNGTLNGDRNGRAQRTSAPSLEAALARRRAAPQLSPARPAEQTRDGPGDDVRRRLCD